jgi:ribosomal protein L16 Arg81 hydroxylase
MTANGIPRDHAAAEVQRANEDPYLLAAKDVQKRLDKAFRLLETFDVLASFRPSGLGVERRTNVSRAEFLDVYYCANRPLVIRNLLDDWPAMRLWNSAYLKDTMGDAEVEIMAGRDANLRYDLEPDRYRRSIRFSEFIDRIYSGVDTNDSYLVANNGFFSNPAASRLQGDFAPPAEYLSPQQSASNCFLWLGPAGAVTRLHYDSCNILAALVMGRKRFKFISPGQTQYLYNEEGVFSSVDCETPNFVKHPDFRKVSIIDVTIEAGETLFIPVGWWHHVRTLEVSGMVSFTNFVVPNSFPLS